MNGSPVPAIEVENLIHPLPFSEPVNDWFTATFEYPTPIQTQGWQPISRGEHSLLLAPTGSGKTLAAFLWALDQVFNAPVDAEPGIKVLYVSPLKALAYDVERNLRAPLTGIHRFAERRGARFRIPQIDLRTGDTNPKERRRQAREPGDILVTTPESLYLILTARGRSVLGQVHTVIVDEVHALAGTKRGAHLALSLERLVHLVDSEPQRIGLSATVQPTDEAVRFLAGRRTVEVVDAVQKPNLDLQVVVPVEDMDAPVVEPTQRSGPLFADLHPPPPERGIWDALYPALLEEIGRSRSVIIFVNSRGASERLAQRLNELSGEEIAWAHHGSVSHEKRAQIEEGLKSGEIRCIVATSTMELGVDMGAVDRVLLVESPGASARGLQRVGRAGHQVDTASVGRIYPKYRGDLLEALVVAERMAEGIIEPIAMPRNPLDVLAQQISAMCIDCAWARSELAKTIRRAGPFCDLTDAALDAVLDMLDGRHAARAGVDLAPRVVWDRAKDELSARQGTAMVVRANAGTIPDRGLYAVHLGLDGPRLGELDEEMVFESRSGEVITLGASSWRVEEITRDRVIVSPAPGEPGRLPFWRGDGPGRPLDLGKAIGRRVRELSSTSSEKARSQLNASGLTNGYAIDNVLAYINDQRESTGAVPTDRCIVVERFRDELGDWRICILTPFGARIHAPWAMAIERCLGLHDGIETQLMYADDGIVVRVADTEALPELALLFPSADEVEDLVVEQLADTARFAAMFRENAARALLLPRKYPAARTPLWAQRLRSARLLSQLRTVADFPIVLETYREALSDALDMPALREVLTGVQSGAIRVHEAETRRASPFARSLVFAYVAAYLYEQDTPLAERRAQALTLDREMLAELVGDDALRNLLDIDVLNRVEAILQSSAEGFKARNHDELNDVLMRVGDLTLAELALRAEGPVEAWCETLRHERRAVPVRISGEVRWIAAMDAGLYRDALGVLPPSDLPASMLADVDDALQQLTARYARRRGPFSAHEFAERFGLSVGQAHDTLELARVNGHLMYGQLHPEHQDAHWCDAEVLRRLKRETLAALRKQVAPVEISVLANFLPRWHGVDAEHSGGDRLLEVIEQLEGVALPWSTWTEEVLPSRVTGFSIDSLEQLCAMGYIVWRGAGQQGPRDGRVAFYLRENLPFMASGKGDPTEDTAWREDASAAIVESLKSRGACFQTELELSLSADGTFNNDAIGEGLRELMWAGAITNDTLAPLKQLGKTTKRSRSRRSYGGFSRGALRSRGGSRAVPGGRWWLFEAPVTPDTKAAFHWTTTLLSRYGIVSREMALAESFPGGFQHIYKILKSMEEAGRVRRGYFIEGLSGAQFALPGAVDVLREERPHDVVRIIPALDPANPYGALATWPTPRNQECTKPRRGAGNWVVLWASKPLAWYSAGKRSLVRFQDVAESEVDWVKVFQALAKLRRPHRHRVMHIEFVDDTPVRSSDLNDAMREAGYKSDHRGIVVSS